MLMFVIIMMMVMVTFAFRIIAFVVIIFDFSQNLSHLLLQRIGLFHGFQNLHAIQLPHRRGNHSGILIVLPDQLYTVINLLSAGDICPAQDNCGSMLDLVDKKFAEIFDIDFRLAGIHNGYQRANLTVFSAHRTRRTNDIAQLANTAGLNQDPIRMIGLQHLLQGLSEITYQTAADASAVHLCDLDAGFLHKATVNSDFTKLIFNQYNLLVCVGILQQFLDQCRLACS